MRLEKHIPILSSTVLPVSKVGFQEIATTVPQLKSNSTGFARFPQDDVSEKQRPGGRFLTRQDSTECTDFAS
jgi:hypothetical protein